MMVVSLAMALLSLCISFRRSSQEEKFRPTFLLLSFLRPCVLVLLQRLLSALWANRLTRFPLRSPRRTCSPSTNPHLLPQLRLLGRLARGGLLLGNSGRGLGATRAAGVGRTLGALRSGRDLSGLGQAELLLDLTKADLEGGDMSVTDGSTRVECRECKVNEVCDP